MYIFILFLFLFSTGLEAQLDLKKKRIENSPLHLKSPPHFNHASPFFSKHLHYSSYVYLTRDIPSPSPTADTVPNIVAVQKNTSISLFFKQISKNFNKSKTNFESFFKNWQNKKDNQVIVFAKPVKIEFKDRISIDSAYFFNQKTNNRSYVYAAYEVESTLERISVHLIEKYSFPKPVPLWVQKTLIYSIYSISQYPVYHEWGHFTRAHALGLQAHFGPGFTFSSSPDIEDFFSFVFDRMSPLRLVFLSLPSTASTYYVSYNTWYNGLSEEEKSDKLMNWNIILSGAGLNNQSDYADFCDEQLFLNQNLSVFKGISAFLHRSASSYYPDGISGSDTTSLKGYYKFENTSPLHEAGLWSILSGSNLALLKSLIKGDPVVTPLTYKGFLMPNQTNYFSSYGLSRKWSSGYGANDHFALLFSLEYVENGKPFQEYMMGFRYKKNEYTTLSKTYVSGTGFFNQELCVEKKFADTWAVSGYFGLWDSRSLVGQRHSLNLKENTSYQLGLKFSYLY